MSQSRIVYNYPGLINIDFNTALGSSFNSAVSSAGLQSNGGVILGGDFTSFNAVTRNRLLRLTSAGAVDTTFYTNLGSNAVSNGVVGSIAVQSNDAIIVGGSFTTIGGTTRNRISRISSTGTVDSTFYTNIGTGGANNDVYVVAVQPSDQFILVGGAFTSLGGTAPDKLGRLNTTGAKDSTFQTNLGSGFAGGDVFALAVQSDGKILVGGSFTSLNGTTRNRIVRLNTNGTVDTSFYTNLGTGISSGYVTSIAVQSDGKILVGGSFSSFNGNTRNNAFRLTSTGTEDTAWYTAIGTGFAGGDVSSISMLTSDNAIFSGFYSTLNGITQVASVVLNSSGAVLLSFGDLFGDFVGATTGSVAGVAVSSTQELFVYGAFADVPPNTSNGLTKLNGISPTFVTPAGVTEATIAPVTNVGATNTITKSITLTPSTSYTITINNAGVSMNSANTFGSLFSWTGSSNVVLSWIE